MTFLKFLEGLLFLCGISFRSLSNLQPRPSLAKAFTHRLSLMHMNSPLEFIRRICAQSKQVHDQLHWKFVTQPSCCLLTNASSALEKYWQYKDECDSLFIYYNTNNFIVTLYQKRAWCIYLQRKLKNTAGGINTEGPYTEKLTGFKDPSYFVIRTYEFLKANLRGSTQVYNTGP